MSCVPGCDQILYPRLPSFESSEVLCTRRNVTEAAETGPNDGRH